MMNRKQILASPSMPAFSRATRAGPFMETKVAPLTNKYWGRRRFPV